MVIDFEVHLLKRLSEGNQQALLMPIQPPAASEKDDYHHYRCMGVMEMREQHG